ncbi:hypothetical protein NQ314_016761 [Rhamnusium bicolor]|uniref:CUB domain-containing protein n=1 Tax=Rhamnusium bicolor TaxID=1586634 RepID=A0AAV8WW01_9CUCU|nr:hypothetical protein NQ314_016761 [Rhamnusium bicolor]
MTVRDGDYENSTLIGKYCRTKSEIITSTHNHLWIRYVNSLAARSSGYSPPLSLEARYTSTDIGKRL